MEREKLFDTIGLNAVMIIDENGIPLLTRHYRQDTPLSQDSLLVSGFFSAVRSFAESMLLSYISDIGMLQSRLFFKYQMNLIYILAFDESRFAKSNILGIRHFVDQILWKLTTEFLTYYEELRSTLKSFALNKRLKDFIPKMDQLMFDGCLEWFNTNQGQIGSFHSVYGSEDEPATIIDRFGIDGCYVFGQEGLVFNHVIAKQNPLSSAGDVMEGFFKGIQAFVTTTQISTTTDIGMFRNRIHVTFFEPYTFLLVVDELKYLSWTVHDTHRIVERILRTTAENFLGGGGHNIPEKAEEVFLTSLTDACHDTASRLLL